MSNNIATILKNLRTDRDYTQQDIANYLNISRSGYANYENGQTMPSTETLMSLSQFYKVSVDYLTRSNISGISGIDISKHTTISDNSNIYSDNISSSYSVKQLITDYESLRPELKDDIQQYMSLKLSQNNKKS